MKDKNFGKCDQVVWRDGAEYDGGLNGDTFGCKTYLFT